MGKKGILASEHCSGTWWSISITLCLEVSSLWGLRHVSIVLRVAIDTKEHNPASALQDRTGGNP